MTSDLDKYKDIYINDMREHLSNMDRCFVDLEQDPENTELLNEIFRAAHTIKGNSATMEYHKVAGLAHDMENLLGKIRNKEMSIDKEIMDVLFEGFDAMESMIDAIADDEDEIDPKDIIEKIKQISDRPQEVKEPDIVELDIKELEIEGPEIIEPGFGETKNDDEIELSIEELRNITDAINSGNTVYELIITINENCALKSAKTIIVIRNLEKFGEKIAVYPAEEIMKVVNPEKFHVILSSKAEPEVLIKSALSVSEISDVKFNVLVDSGNEIDDNSGFDIGSFEEPEIAKEDISQKKKRVDKKPEPVEKPSKKSQQTIQNVRVNITQLDSLVNRVGELVINKISLEHLISNYEDPELQEAVSQLNRIVEDMQNEVMEIRMVPVDHLFSKYPRIIRDLAKKKEKKIKLIVDGGDIELDRTVLDGLNDPLVHILRNSVDHGIETPQQRLMAGKPEEGIVHLSAKREKNRVIIEISDDGNGIPPEVIKDSAISKGLISEEEADKMSDDEIIYLILMPGFSTAKVVTDISGRGVGMDVVKRDVEKLGGSVRIHSKPGKGSKFELKLPLTLAIVKALIVKVGVETYVLPLNNVVESALIDNNQIKMVDKQETYILRENIIPLIRLNEVFEIESSLKKEDNPYVVIVEHEANEIGLVVDELVDQQEVVIKSLGRSLGRLQGFAGATIIKNGKVALIVDTNSLLTMI
jgi:two-component system chemotaxis sensor kinase CheA